MSDYGARKVCNKCGEQKNIAEFGKDKRNSDGLQGNCNACKNFEKQQHRDKRVAAGNYRQVIEKSCNKCSLTKSIDLFFKDKAMSDGHSSICKECKKADVYKWREANKDKYNADMRAYQKTVCPQKRYGAEIKRRYGCTLEMYNAMLVRQEGACALCGKLHNPAEKKGRLYVDHCHKTGKIRALLCGACNSMLGYAKDDTRILLEAVAYIKRHA